MPLIKSLLAMLPNGQAWAAKRVPESLMYRFALAVMLEFERLKAMMLLWITFINPAITSGDWLDTWETELGLPDPCQRAVELTLSERQNNAYRKLVFSNSGTLDGLREQILLSGYTNTYLFEESQGLVAGGDIGSDIWSEEDLHTLVLYSKEVQELAYFGAGSEAGDPLNTTRDDSFLRCLVARIKPAHVLIRYVALAEGELPPV